MTKEHITVLIRALNIHSDVCGNDPDCPECAWRRKEISDAIMKEKQS